MLWLSLGPDRHSSPRHVMPLISRSKGATTADPRHARVQTSQGVEVEEGLQSVSPTVELIRCGADPADS